MTDDTWDLFNQPDLPGGGEDEDPLPSPEERLEIELREKERILDEHEERMENPLEWLRGEMRDLYRHRYFFEAEMPQVNANDAREVLQANGMKTGPWMGALFRTKGWVRLDRTVPSTAEGSHGRILWCYRPSDLNA